MEFKKISSWDMHILFYALILAAAVLTAIVITMKKRGCFLNTATLVNTLKIFSLVIVLALFYMQTMTMMSIFIAEYYIFANKTVQEKYRMLFEEDIYEFAEFCKRHTSDNMEIEFISDLSLDHDPGHFDIIEFAYFMSPVRILTERPSKKPDAIIYFKVQHLIEKVPDRFSRCAFDNNKEIFIKKYVMRE